MNDIIIGDMIVTPEWLYYQYIEFFGEEKVGRYIITVA